MFVLGPRPTAQKAKTYTERIKRPHRIVSTLKLKYLIISQYGRPRRIVGGAQDPKRKLQEN